MNKKSALLLYISLACGILFILLGIVLLLLSNAKSSDVQIPLLTFLLLTTGAVSLFFSIAITQRAFFLYLGLNMCFFGLLSLSLAFNVFDLTFYKIWPLGMIFGGVSLVPSGYFRYRKMHTAYIFPSVVLILLGLLFCLFSFDILKVSFSRFVACWWPAALIILGTVLVAVFIIQKKNQTSFPYIREDELDEYDGAGEEL